MRDALRLGLLLVLLASTGCAHFKRAWSEPEPVETTAAEDSVRAREKLIAKRAREVLFPPTQDDLPRTRIRAGRYLNRETGETITIEPHRSGPAANRVFADIVVDGEKTGELTIEKLAPIGGGTMVVTALRHLNVRSCPSTSCRVTRQLARYDRPVVTTLENGWWALAEGGYAAAPYMITPEAWVIVQEALVEKATLTDMPQFTGPVPFDLPGWAKLVGSTVYVDFYVRGRVTRQICEALTKVADYFEYSFGEVSRTTEIHGFQVRALDGSDPEPVAQLTADGGIYCNMAPPGL